jgi:hypothetical protein
VGMAIFTHINALMFAFFCLVVAVHALRDFKNTSIYAGGLGVLLTIGAYWAFTHVDPTAFRAQMGWNAGLWGRTYAWSHPVAGIWREVQRWVPLYATTSGSKLQQLGYTTISAISIGALVAVCMGRRAPTTSMRWLVATYAVGTVLTFAFFNNISSAFYFFYRSFAAELCVVALLTWFWREKWMRGKALWATAIALVFAFHVSKDVAFLRDSLRASSEFAALERAAVANLRSDDVASGPAELAFAYRFSPNYISDENYGFYSGRRPDLVALYREDSASNLPLVASALGGTCVGNSEGSKRYAQFITPRIAGELARNLDRLCSYLRDLTANSRTLYRNSHYEIVRIDRPTALSGSLP